MSTLFFFIDGLGIGKADPAVNPCVGRGLKYFNFSIDNMSSMPHAGVVVPADANLGVEGLPQSATGQVTLFTGVNAARVLGRHLPGFPNEKLRQILKEKSLLLQVKKMGLKPVFINTFRAPFFDIPEKTRWKMSASTCATLAAGIDFYDVDRVARDETLYHDYTNEGLISRGFSVPRFSADKAGQVLAASLNEFDFVLYEYFLTDKAGHARDMSVATAILQGLDEVLESLLCNTDLGKHTIIITSDHGNIEDFSAKPHTRNPVPIMIWGPGSEKAQSLKSIEDVTPFILAILGRERISD